jgi:hypothetical protein
MEQKTEKRKFYKLKSADKAELISQLGIENSNAQIYADNEKIFIPADFFLSLVEEAWLERGNGDEVMMTGGEVYPSLDLLLGSLPFSRAMLESIRRSVRDGVAEKKLVYAFETECSKQDS